MSEVQPTVEYREIPEFPGYRVGNDGSVWTCWRIMGCGVGHGSRSVMSEMHWRKLKGNPLKKKGGHLIVALKGKDKKVRYLQVHRLVLEVFIGPCPPGKQCCHYDDDPLNNAVGNLRWDTAKANKADAARNGRTARGERGGGAKLTEMQAIAILADYMRLKENGQTTYGFVVSCARRHKVSRHAILRLVHRHNWKHLKPPAVESC